MSWQWRFQDVSYSIFRYLSHSFVISDFDTIFYMDCLQILKVCLSDKLYRFILSFFSWTNFEFHWRMCWEFFLASESMLASLLIFILNVPVKLIPIGKFSYFAVGVMCSPILPIHPHKMKCKMFSFGLIWRLYTYPVILKKALFTVFMRTKNDLLSNLWMLQTLGKVFQICLIKAVLWATGCG